jgi:hypothetical protein
MSPFDHKSIFLTSSRIYDGNIGIFSVTHDEMVDNYPLSQHFGEGMICHGIESALEHFDTRIPASGEDGMRRYFTSNQHYDRLPPNVGQS